MRQGRGAKNHAAFLGVYLHAQLPRVAATQTSGARGGGKEMRELPEMEQIGMYVTVITGTRGLRSIKMPSRRRCVSSF